MSEALINLTGDTHGVMWTVFKKSLLANQQLYQFA
jgi:hypothetical protein